MITFNLEVNTPLSVSPWLCRGHLRNGTAQPIRQQNATAKTRWREGRREKNTLFFASSRLRGCIGFFLMGVALSVASSTHADTSTTQPDPPAATHELLAGVQKKLLTVESIQADFTQQKNLTVLKHKLNISGHFAMQKPDKFVWDVNAPVKYAIKVEGDEIRQWDEDTNKVQVIHAGGDPTFKAITDQIQSWFLGDYKSLEQSYDVFVLNEKPLSLRFAPKGGSMISKLIKNIEVTFSDDRLQINQMLIHETSGDLTTLNYSNVRLNQPISSDTWEIPPK